MNGSPAKLGTISGTAGHSSALKMKAEADAASALKQMELTKEETKGMVKRVDKDGNQTGLDLSINATGTEMTTKGGKKIKIDPKSKSHKAILDTRWKKGDKASGGTLNELVAARKGLDKGSAEYAAIQNKINKALGSKKVHEGTKVNNKGETVKTAPKGTKKTTITDDKGTKDTSDDTTTTEDRMKGLQRKKGKTLEYTRKVAEGVRIDKEKEDIKKAKASGDKLEKVQSQKEISEIKSGRDDKYTGTVLSRAWHKARAKIKGNKEAKLKAKQK